MGIGITPQVRNSSGLMFVQMLKESREEKMSSGDRFSKKKNVFFDIFFFFFQLLFRFSFSRNDIEYRYKTNLRQCSYSIGKAIICVLLSTNRVPSAPSRRPFSKFQLQCFPFLIQASSFYKGNSNKYAIVINWAFNCLLPEYLHYLTKKDQNGYKTLTGQKLIQNSTVFVLESEILPALLSQAQELKIYQLI